MSIINATTLRKNLIGYLDAAIHDEKIIVTTKGGNAAIVSEEYLRGLEETCYLCAIPGMARSIQDGMNTPIGECAEFDWEK